MFIFDYIIDSWNFALSLLSLIPPNATFIIFVIISIFIFRVIIALL